MADEDQDLDDKTEEASQHRRDEWKKEGRVSQSKELTSAILLLAALLTMYLFASWSMKGVSYVFESSLGELRKFALTDWSIQTFSSVTSFAIRSFLLILMPIGICSAIVGISASLMQTGFIWSTKPLELDITKLNPVKGFQKIFSLNGIFELIKSILKMAVCLASLYWFFRSLLLEVPNIWAMNIGGLLGFLGPQLLELMVIVAGAMLIVSLIDYGWQKFQFERKIKMTKQEAKDERKQLEGDPAIKARVRAIQKQVASRRMLDAVMTADVVITNPTHIAVALVFDRENMMAPKVVAKGADYMAEKIKSVARENGVPCVENVPLARALFKALKIGQFISREFYNAVAEVLAYVYRIKGKAT